MASWASGKVGGERGVRPGAQVKARALLRAEVSPEHFGSVRGHLSPFGKSDFSTSWSLCWPHVR